MIVTRKQIAQLGTRWMPFADAVSADLTLAQLWRLAAARL